MFKMKIIIMIVTKVIIILNMKIIENTTDAVNTNSDGCAKDETIMMSDNYSDISDDNADDLILYPMMTYISGRLYLMSPLVIEWQGTVHLQYERYIHIEGTP